MLFVTFGLQSKFYGKFLLFLCFIIFITPLLGIIYNTLLSDCDGKPSSLPFFLYTCIFLPDGQYV